MRRVWNSFKIAFSMYSRIPMPKAEWTEENMSYAMCFFPWIGAVTGALTYGLYMLKERVCNIDGVEAELFFTILLVLLPVVITGGIHLDGYLDTKDALSSYQTRERRLEILKDPHTGAFAVISCTVYFVCYVGIYSALTDGSVKVVCLSFMLSRSLSALSVVCFPKAGQKGLAAAFAKQADKRVCRGVLTVYIAFLCGAFFCAGGYIGVISLLTAGGIFFYYYRMSVGKFGGITGDLAGYFLQVCEILVAAAAVITDMAGKGLGI